MLTLADAGVVTPVPLVSTVDVVVVAVAAAVSGVDSNTVAALIVSIVSLIGVDVSIRTRFLLSIIIA